MKKILLVFALFIVANIAKSQINIGLKGGLNISKISGTIQFSSIPSFAVGAYTQIPLNDNIDFQPEIIYNATGGKFETAKTKLNYINLPLLAKYNVANTDLSIIGGPQLGLVLSANTTSEGITESIKQEVNSFEFSGVTGLQYSLSDKFIIGSRYQFGLSNIFKTTDVSEIFPLSISLKNSVFNFYVGINL